MIEEGYVFVLGEEHPYSLDSLAALAACYYKGGKVEMALELYEKVYESYERIFGSQRPRSVKIKHMLESCRSELS